jgi:hypothetical protein
MLRKKAEMSSTSKPLLSPIEVNSHTSFDSAGFWENFNGLELSRSQFSHEIAINADVATILRWLHPRHTRELHPLAVDVALDCEENPWRFRVTDRLVILGVPFLSSYSVHAQLCHGESDVRICYIVNQSSGLKMYQLWTLQTLGPRASMLKEVVRFKSMGLMILLNGYIWRQANDAHERLLMRIKIVCEIEKDLKY